MSVYSQSLNGLFVTINDTWFATPLPAQGKLRFDFVSVIRPPTTAIPVTAKQLAALKVRRDSRHQALP